MTVVGGSTDHFIVDRLGNVQADAVLEVRTLAGVTVTDVTAPVGWTGQAFPEGKARADGDGYFKFVVPDVTGPVQVRTAAHTEGTKEFAAGPWLDVSGQVVPGSEVDQRLAAMATDADIDAKVAAQAAVDSATYAPITGSAAYAHVGLDGLVLDALHGEGAATGDGVSDDTTALNALLATAATFGATVLIGKHAVTGSVNLPAGTGLRGRNGDSQIILPAGAAFPAVLIDGADNVRATGFRVTRAGATASGACAVAVRGDAADVLVEDVSAESLYEGFRVEGGLGGVPGTVRRLVLSRCAAADSTSYGFRIDDTDGLEMNSCSSVVSGLDGIKLRKLTRNVTITGGYFTGATGGDGLDAYAGGDTFTIQGGTFTGNSINGITIKCDDLNKSDPAGYGYVRNITVSGVHCDNNTGNGLTVHRNSDTDDPTEPLVSRATIQGGTFNGNGGRGIYIRARQVSLMSPMCARNGTEGIDVQDGSVDVTIAAPQVAGNSRTTPGVSDGIRVAGDRVQVIGGSSIGTDVDGATSDADVAAGSKTQRYGLRIDATASDVVVFGIALKYNATAPFSDTSNTAYVLPGASDDSSWPQINLPNNKRIYVRTSTGSSASAMYMTTGNALNLGDSTLVGSISLLAAGTVNCFPKFAALGDFAHSGSKAGFFGSTPIVKPSITGSRAGESAASASTRAALVALGLATDNTTA